MAATVAPSGDFEIADALSFGWDRFKANIGPLAITVAVVIFVEIVLSVISSGRTGFGGFILSLVTFLIGQIIAMGWVRISLNIVGGRPAGVSDMWERLDLFVPYVVAAIIFSVMVGIGFILLIVPGVYLALTFGFYGFNVMDKEMGALDALKRSVELTRGRKWKLLAFWVTILFLNLLGLILLVVGVLVTAGVSLIAVGYVYRSLEGARPPLQPSPQT
jgi:uncharacterized membrane protein